MSDTPNLNLLKLIEKIGDEENARKLLEAVRWPEGPVCPHYYKCPVYPMSTKLVKLEVPDQLHRRIKTLAASRDEKIQTYVLAILEEYVPRHITFPDEEVKKKSKGPVN
jgi:hypothetical protein